MLSIEHDIAEVTHGPVLSDDITRVNFVNQNGNRVKEGSPAPTTPGNPSVPKPPATGDGIADDSGTDDPTVLLGAAAVAVGGLGAGGFAVSRKR